MSISIKDKLRELDRLTAGTAAVPRPVRAVDLESLLGGSEENGCFVVERRYALDQLHGSIRLASLRELSRAALVIAGKDERLRELDLQRALFVDTETTGLAGGTGTLAFLVGTGYFEENEFVVRQYFLRQPHEEPAMISALQTHAALCQGLVTFNGKSFDIPLLLARTVLNRAPIAFDRLPHFDVLHAARRIWKDHLGDCSLLNLESQILGIRRTGDVPSSLIPQIYFDFVRTGEADHLPEIFAHNRQDIVTTAALLSCIGWLVQSPYKYNASRYELRKVGKLYRDAGLLEDSARLFEELVSQSDGQRQLEDHLALGFCYKSQSRYDEACRIWQTVIEEFPFHPVPFIEYAKHLEHRQRDFQRAHDIVLRALRSVTTMAELDNNGSVEFYRNDLRRRELRLRWKRENQA